MKHYLKESVIFSKTTNRREYHILHDIKPKRAYIYDCDICPMYNHCIKHKHIGCFPDRIRERNWKSQSKKPKQWG